MGNQTDPERPFLIPYAPCAPERSEARAKMQAPFIECILGVGEDAVSARPGGRAGLGTALIRLFSAGEIRSWDEVALLFRAQPPFSIYEQALEELAFHLYRCRHGFYDRPEVRMCSTCCVPWRTRG